MAEAVGAAGGRAAGGGGGEKEPKSQCKPGQAVWPGSLSWHCMHACMPKRQHRRSTLRRTAPQPLSTPQGPLTAHAALQEVEVAQVAAWVQHRAGDCWDGDPKDDLGSGGGSGP